jgi:hypothetical protein
MNRSRYCMLFFSALLAGIIPLGFSQHASLTSTAGGRGGTPFTDGVVSGAFISEVHIYSGDYVDAILIQYILPDGRKALGPLHGGSGGRQNIFRLDSDEYIVGLSIKYGEHIDSIRIETNKHTSPMYGGRGGSRSSRVDVPSGNQAIGFTGRSGEFLDSIGLAYIPLPLLISGKTEIGGGNGGNAFSDRNIPLGAIISEVRVSAGKNIDSIQLVYVLKDRRAFEGPVHGGQGGNPNVFRLNSGEYITGVSGRYGDYIDSLSIRTNQRVSQTFGGPGGNRNFSISIPQGNMMVSLSGRAGERLDAISLYFAPIDKSLQRSRGNRAGSGR